MSRLDDLRSVFARADDDLLAADERFLSRTDAVRVALRRGEDVSDARILAAMGQIGHAAGTKDDELARIFSEATGKRSAAGTQTAAVQAAQGKLAVVQLSGFVNYSLDFPPYATSTRALAATAAELGADDTIKGVLLLVDSPGGMVTGLQEAADALWSLAQSKPLTAVVDPLSASAALWLSSQASTVSILSSGEIGSIGVRTAHLNVGPSLAQSGLELRQYAATGSPKKLEGNMFERPSAETEQYWQSQLDATMADFVSAVARGRDTTARDVLANYGKGRVLRATDGLRVGLVDRVELPSAAFNRARAGKMLTRAQADLERARAEL